MTYRDDYRGFERDVYWTTPRVFAWLAVVVILGGGLATVGSCVGLFAEAVDNGAQVVKKEFYPDALLRKYEWFKESAAALDAKQADMRVYDQRVSRLREDYGSPKGWPRDVREQAAIWASEAAGIRASYNSLAAEYNAEMAKFNWRFTNVGDVPQGGRPLPRDYRPYQEGQQ